ncbi:sensor domain-containing diguanylate cyclase [Sulfurirhabdus autotrophica]|uniref:Sensor protein FixL n=1 Tax=Sulfurirhabdus autotrophica TaxID=1706046 RepID=A0A4R3YCW4_9PROT|nr:diguanylate cyclase [Sulfurirhabdus autotrophica]TCV89662.1 PAS domain S-box-containing protein/diguanylate cyclase (GGDEF)-like protein [Sulfurirhabdus autotrophica]
MKHQKPALASHIAHDRLKRFCQSPVKILLAIGASIFVAETVVMIVLHLFQLSPVLETVLDGVILLSLLAPILYVFLFRPLIQHIEEHKQINELLQANALNTEAILNNAFDGIVTIDENGIIQSFNSGAEKIFGFTSKELIGQSVNRLMPDAYRGAHDRNIANYLSTGKAKIIGVGRELPGQRKNGEVFSMDLALTEMNLMGKRQFVGTIRDISERKRSEQALKQAYDELDKRVQERTSELTKVNVDLELEITERKRAEKKLQQLATTDALTGITNRGQFDAILEKELVRAQRYHTPIYLIMFDIDHFKRVNDNFGHLIGDSVLVQLAKLVSEKIRLNDVFARWGGEEFVLLLTGGDMLGALRLAENLRMDIQSFVFPEVGRVTCSFGVAEFAEADAIKDLVRRADMALYKAKANGRNRVEVA